MAHHYRITLEECPTNDAEHEMRQLSFGVTNHDDLFDIVASVCAKDIVPPAEVIEFSIGLKLFGEILIRHRSEPMFRELFGQFGTFMKKLKAHEPTPRAAL